MVIALPGLLAQLRGPETIVFPPAPASPDPPF